MSCNCKLCNAREFFQDVTYHDGRYVYSNTEVDIEVEVEKPTSLYDRLCELSKELDRYGAPAKFIQEVNDLAELADDIDSEIIKLKGECLSESREYTCSELGEISKKLF